MANLKNEQLRRFARLGAMARLEQLKMEEATIRAEFPELFGRGARPAGATSTARRRGRRPMSAAERRTVSARMKKYWAARRKAKGTK